MTEVFLPRTFRWVVGVGSASFVLFLVLSLFGDVVFDRQSPGPDTYSSSAVGHKALFKWLEALDVPVRRVRVDPLARTVDDLLLILAPNSANVGVPGAIDLSQLQTRRRLGPVLLTLPKWWAQPDEEDHRKVGHHALDDDHEDILDALSISASVSRANQAPSFDKNPFSTAPHLDPTQLLKNVSDLDPVVSGPRGALLARRGDLWILSDPDVFSTRGLADDNTARFAIEVFESIRGGRPVAVDETLHGHIQRSGGWREFFHFPLSLVLVQSLFVIALVVWRGMQRFGDPRPIDPPLPPGKEALVGNTASLMAFAGREPEVIARYYQLHSDLVAKHLRMARLEPADRLRALSELSDRRGATHDPARLAREAAPEQPIKHMAPHRFLTLARHIRSWRQEIVDGPSVHSTARR